MRMSGGYACTEARAGVGLLPSRLAVMALSPPDRSEDDFNVLDRGGEFLLEAEAVALHRM